MIDHIDFGNLPYKDFKNMVKKTFLMALVTLASIGVQSQQLDRVNIYSEYDSLKEVFLGTANTLYFPESHEIEKEEKATGISKFLTKQIYPRFAGKKVPNWIAKKFRKEEQQLLEVLKEHDVTILRPEDVNPLPGEPLGLGQMYARDPIISVGNMTINSQLQISMRRKENRGYEKLLEELVQQGGYVETLNDEESYLEGGDVIVNYPYIFVGQSKYGSNQKGIDWLKEKVGDTFQIVPVEITDPSVLHLDCAMTIIGDKMGIIHRKSLTTDLPEPLCNYDFIEVDDKTAKELGTNVLVINPKTIIVQKRHKKLIKDLKEKGFDVIPVSFTWHARMGGSFRCATSPIIRK